METVTDLTWGVSKITADGNCSHEIKRHLLLGRKAMTNLDRILKSRDIISADKCPSNRSYGFSSSHVWMGELNYKESWVPKNCCFWTVVLEKTLESPLDFKEIKPVHLKGNQSWIFKTLMLGKIECRTRRGRQRMRWLNGITDSMDMNLSKFRELVMGQGSLVCCSPRDSKESDTTERLNWRLLDVGSADRGRCKVGREGAFCSMFFYFCMVLLCATLATTPPPPKSESLPLDLLLCRFQVPSLFTIPSTLE